MRWLAVSSLFALSLQTMAQDAMAPEPDPAVYTTVVQVCRATDPGCVSVHRNSETITVMRGQEIVARVPIQAPPPSEPPVVQVCVTDADTFHGTVAETLKFDLAAASP